MNVSRQRFGLCGGLLVIGGVFAGTEAAHADTLLTDFDNFSLTGSYAAFAAGTQTSGPTSFNVQAGPGFGGGFFDLDPNVDATGETMIALDITVNATDEVAGLGSVLVLVDEDGTEWAYSQFGLLPGVTHNLVFDVDTPSFVSVPGATEGIDVSDLSFFHLQIDPGTTGVAYDVSYENLSLISGAGIPGDYNDSGQVEQGDLDLVLSNWGRDTDANGVPDGWDHDLPMGQIEQTELDGVLSNWGATAAPVFTGSAVPEPTGTGLAALAGAALMRRRRHA